MEVNVNNFFSNTFFKPPREDNYQREIIKNIIKTKIELDAIRQNYEFAESDLIDYYLYQIKANQSKLDFLIKQAKSQNVSLSAIEKMNYDAII